MIVSEARLPRTRGNLGLTRVVGGKLWIELVQLFSLQLPLFQILKFSHPLTPPYPGRRLAI